MFWGLIMEPQRRYTQHVKKAFHVSMAALDVSTSSDEPAQVMCGFEGRNYLLCTLKKPDMLQCSLDLNFEVGSELSFAANGKGHVHLTGYLIEEPLEGLSDEEEEVVAEAEQESATKNRKRRGKDQENGTSPKKAKASSSNKKQDSDSDDSDVDVKALLEKSFGESDDDESFNSDINQESEEEEDDEEEEEGEEEEEEGGEESSEESSANEEDSDEEVEVSPKKNKKAQINGIVKEVPTPKQKKEKKNQQRKEEKKTPKKDEKTPKKEEKTPKKEGQGLKKKELQGGVVIEDLREGQGAIAKSGKFVTVYYEGRLKHNNKLFDATSKGAGFSFRLGSSEVIKGWDIGVQGMKVGGKRKITCPPAMAYGQKGSPPAIPANSSLVFEVELKKVR